MRIGVVILPEHRWPEASRRWRRVEELGFDHAWTYDHLAWRTLADGPWFATVPTLTAAATVTSRIQLGTWVASPNFRHPVTFAKELMTLDDLSAGRMLLGVGAGGLGFDAEVLGQPVYSPAERVQRLGEFVELLDQLLREPVTDYTGRFFQAVGARMYPGCVQQPRLPFVVAANGPKAMRLAARFGSGWATSGPADADGQASWWTGVERMAQTFAGIEHESGARVPGRYLSLDGGGFALSSLDHFTDMVGRAADAGFTDVVVHWPRPDGVYAGSEHVLDDVGAILPELAMM